MIRLATIIVGASLLALSCQGGPAKTPDKGPRATGPSSQAVTTDSKIVALGFASSSRHFAHLSEDGTVQLWDVLRKRKTSGHRFGPGAAALDLSGPRTVVVADTTGVHVFDAEGRKDRLLTSPSQPVRFVRVERGGERIAVATADGRISVLRLGNGNTVHEIDIGAPENRWRALPTGDFGALFLDGTDRARLVDFGATSAAAPLVFERDPRDIVAVSADGAIIASLAPSGRIEVRGAADGAMRTSVAGFDGPPHAIALSPDGSVLAMVRGEGVVELWDAETAERLDRFEASIWPAGGVRFSPDGYLLAWAESDRTKLRFWSPLDGVVEWTDGTAVVSPAARNVGNLAAMLRFRLAGAPFERALAALQAGDAALARAALTETRRLMPGFPGIEQAASRAAELYAHQRVVESIDNLVQAGRYREAVNAIEEFLATPEGEQNDLGLADRARMLEQMLGHLAVADQLRAAGRRVAALEKFDQARKLAPGLAAHRDDYGELRAQVTGSLQAQADKAFADNDYERVIEIQTAIERLQPLDDVAWLRAGQAHEQLGQAEPARDAYQRVATRSEGYALARWGLARLAIASGNPEVAEAELGAASKAAPENAEILAAMARLLAERGKLDQAAVAWLRTAELMSDDPEPMVALAAVQEQRTQWKPAVDAYREALRRSTEPMPRILWRMAQACREAGTPQQGAGPCLELLAMIEGGEDLSWIGPTPERTLHTALRAADLVPAREGWIPRDRFLSQQGWVRHKGSWMRPEVVQLHEIVARYGNIDPELRARADDGYRADAKNGRVARGMDRAEVIEAWGFFEDHNVLVTDGGATTYEQLIYGGERRVYLRGGLVFLWSE